MRFLWDACSPPMFIKMRQGLLDIHHALDKCGWTALPLGTACSGSDVVVPTLQLIAKFWTQQYDIPIAFDH
eukprot:8078648-Pyramimonas_sp.AAC.1